MNFENHTARMAASQIAQGVDLADIETLELDNLCELIRAELEDRQRRIAPPVVDLSYLNGVPF